MKTLQWLPALALVANMTVQAAPAPVHAFTVDALRGQTAQEALRAERRTAAAIRARHLAAELHPATSIGFVRDVALDDQITALLARRYARELAALPVPAPQPLAIDSNTLQRIFGKGAQLQLAYTLSPGQQALAARTPLMRYGAVVLSVHDVLRRQNVQGRMEFFAHNLAFMRAQARSRVASLHLQGWARRTFGADAVADLRQALADKDDVRAGMALYGLGSGPESESAIQRALARAVTPTDIDAWYAAHRGQFRRVERVRARHISATSEALAREVMAGLQQGASFDALAKRHSQAASARRGGQLGWIKPSETQGWLAGLVLMQPVGQASGPFRTPVGPKEQASWEIVMVEERIEGFHPRHSETVRYGARKAIAAARARQQFAALAGGRP